MERDGDADGEDAELETAPESDSSIDQPYDAMMRRWAERNLPTVAGWLDPTVAGLPTKAYVQRPATFALPSIFADLLTTAGKNRLLHVEYETSPRPGPDRPDVQLSRPDHDALSASPAQPARDRSRQWPGSGS